MHTSNALQQYIRIDRTVFSSHSESEEFTMKMTKRLVTMAMCGVMAASSMVGMSASASESCDTPYITTNFIGGNNVNSINVADKQLDYDIWKQSKSTTCWAVCASSMHKYITNPSEAFTEDELIDKLNAIDGCDASNGASPDEMLKLMKKIFPTATYTLEKKSSLTGIRIKNIIDDKMPIYVSCDSTDGSGVGHGVVIVGYKYSGTLQNLTTVYYANPASGNIESVPFNESSTKFTTTLDDGSIAEYKWRNAITVTEK